MGDHRPEDAPGDPPLEPDDQPHERGGEDEQRDAGRGGDQGVDDGRRRHGVPPADPGVEGAALVQLLGDAVDGGDHRDDSEGPVLGVVEQLLDRFPEDRDPRHQHRPDEEEGEQRQP